MATVQRLDQISSLLETLVIVNWSPCLLFPLGVTL